MATPVINAPSGMIRHTKVDFALRETFEPVHAVQGDAVLPVIAVAMYLNSEPYVLPDGATVNIRLDKKDKHYCYNEALGCDSTRTTVYFQVSKQMASTPGELSPEIEVVSGAGIAGSSRFPFIVDRSNINEDLIESTTEGQTIIMYAQQATESATAAKASAQAAATSEANAKTDADRAESAQAAIQQIQDTASASAQAAALSEANAKASEKAAKESETAAKASETAASASEINTKESETAAKASETKASKSEANAKTSETAADKSAQAAALSEANAKSSETAAALSETNAKASETAVAASEVNAKKSETAAAASESNAKTSEDNSKNYMELSHSYMDGGGESGREGEATDNAKYYSEQAKAYADKAEAATNVGIATPDKAGLVKPDGKTITIEADGTIKGANVDDKLDTDSVDPVQNKVVAKEFKALEGLLNSIITTGKVTVQAVTKPGDNLVTKGGDTLVFTKKIGG